MICNQTKIVHINENSLYEQFLETDINFIYRLLLSLTNDNIRINEAENKMSKSIFWLVFKQLNQIKFIFRFCIPRLIQLNKTK